VSSCFSRPGRLHVQTAHNKPPGPEHTSLRGPTLPCSYFSFTRNGGPSVKFSGRDSKFRLLPSLPVPVVFFLFSPPVPTPQCGSPSSFTQCVQRYLAHAQARRAYGTFHGNCLPFGTLLRSRHVKKKLTSDTPPLPVPVLGGQPPFPNHWDVSC